MKKKEGEVLGSSQKPSVGPRDASYYEEETVAGKRYTRFWSEQVRRREGADLKHVALEDAYDRWQRKELLSTTPGQFYEDLSAAGLAGELSKYDHDQGEEYAEMNNGVDFVGLELVPLGETA